MSTQTKTFTYKIKPNEDGVTRATVEIELEKRSDGKIIFSACGELYRGGRNSDCCGQCLDEIAKYVSDLQFLKIHTIWKHYHLNHMNAGTHKQMLYLFKNGSGDSYEETKEILKAAGIYDDNGNKYGYHWYYQEIPSGILAEIETLLG